MIDLSIHKVHNLVYAGFARIIIKNLNISVLKIYY